MPARELVGTVPTTFHDDGTLDRDGQVAIAAAYAAAGCAALLALDVTGGEPEMLDRDERDRVVRATLEGAAGMRLLVGVGRLEPATTARARLAVAAGADGLVVLAPRLAGDEDHLEEVAGFGLPLWLHAAPAAGSTAPAEVVQRLLRSASDVAAEALIIEVPPTCDAVAAAVAAGHRVLGGLAALFLAEEVDAGAAGTIASSAVPERVAEILSDVPADGPMDLDGYLAALAYLRLEAGSVGVTVRKEAWRQRGVLASGRMRRGHPLGAASKLAITRRLRAVGIRPSAPYPGA